MIAYTDTCEQEQGVELRHLSAEAIQTDCSKVVYLVRSQLSLMKYISSHIHNDTSKGLQREYFLYFVPRRSVACEKVTHALAITNKVYYRSLELDGSMCMNFNVE